VTGNGVTFYVTGSGAGVDFGGTSSATLSAPITGPLAGILFFGDRDLATNKEFAFKGGPTFHFEGTIYALTAEVRFAGHPTAISPSPYTIVIAYRFTFNGIGELVLNADYADSTVPVPTGLGPQEPRLVM